MFSRGLLVIRETPSDGALVVGPAGAGKFRVAVIDRAAVEVLELGGAEGEEAAREVLTAPDNPQRIAEAAEGILSGLGYVAEVEAREVGMAAARYLPQLGVDVTVAAQTLSGERILIEAGWLTRIGRDGSREAWEVTEAYAIRPGRHALTRVRVDGREAIWRSGGVVVSVEAVDVDGVVAAVEAEVRGWGEGG